MKLVFREWWKDQKAFWAFMLYLLARIARSGVSTFLVKFIADIISEPERLTENLLMFAVIAGASVIIDGAEGYLNTYACSRFYESASMRWANKLLEADYEMFTKYSVSNITSASSFLDSMIQIWKHSAMTIANLVEVIMVLVSLWLVGGPMVFPIGILYVVATIVFKLIYKQFEKIEGFGYKINREIKQASENLITGFKELRAFNRVGVMRSQVADLLQKNRSNKLRKSKSMSLLYVVIGLVDNGATVIAIMYAIAAIASGQLSTAVGLAVVFYCRNLMDPILTILDLLDSFSSGFASKKDFQKIVEYVNRSEDRGSVVLSSFSSSIEVKDLSFSYGSSSNALNHVSMVIKKGEKVGICGVSGGGKSTLLKLLNKFYVPSSGSIEIDGIDLQDYTSESVWKKVGTVFQDNVIFPGSIKNNITLGDENVTEFEIIEACRRANIWDFIQSLDDKLNTEVGPRGLTLSGGQCQRLALARLFLKDPEIVLMDEATSALDNESESIVQEAIEKMEGRTIVTVAHRLSTIRNCDKIYVLGPSGVIESGTHDELMALRGAYYAMQK